MFDFLLLVVVVVVCFLVLLFVLALPVLFVLALLFSFQRWWQGSPFDIDVRQSLSWIYFPLDLVCDDRSL